MSQKIEPLIALLLYKIDCVVHHYYFISADEMQFSVMFWSACYCTFIFPHMTKITSKFRSLFSSFGNLFLQHAQINISGPMCLVMC